jgi:hypothetical protein
MALFPRASDPQKKAQRDLNAARATRDKLIERRNIAETSAAEHREKARKLAREGGDDHALSAAETEMRREQDRTATYNGAISDVEATIADLERKIAQIIDQSCRKETAAAVTALADKWASVGAAFDAAAGELADTARESAVIVLDAHPLQVFLEAVKQQVPPAADVVTNVLRDHARAVLAGTAPASLPKPQAEPAKLTVPEPARETRPQHIAPVTASDPLASADFQVIDRSADARTLNISVARP